MTDQPNKLVLLLENMLLTPSSDFYISTILYNPNGTSADPFTAKSVALGTFDVEDIKVGITVTDLSVKGLSNVQVIFSDGKPEITVDGDTVTFNVKLPNTQTGYERPPSVPDQVTMSGVLNVTINGEVMPPGTIDVVVKTVAKATGTFVATEETAGKLSTAKIDVTAITLAPGTQTGNIHFDIKLDTVFSPTINCLLNQSGTQDELVAKINTEINDPNTLAKISAAATDKARQALKNQ